MSEFKNRENKVYQTEDGPIWASRSVALLGVLIFILKGKVYVLAEKRSQKMDSPGLWCVPCGYIDWDETAYEGVKREVYEETGLSVDDLNEMCKIKDPISPVPFYVNSDPSENRQNITLSYSFLYNVENDEYVKKIFECENFKNDEIDEVKLIPLLDIRKYTWAFNHEERIMMGATSQIISQSEILMECVDEFLGDMVVITH